MMVTLSHNFFTTPETNDDGSGEGAKDTEEGAKDTGEGANSTAGATKDTGEGTKDTAVVGVTTWRSPTGESSAPNVPAWRAGISDVQLAE